MKRLLRHRNGAYIRRPPFTVADSFTMANVVRQNDYRINEWLTPCRVVDVGAHIGAFAFLMNSSNPCVSLICIEPNVDCIECLAANAPGATIHNAAVSYSGEASCSFVVNRKFVDWAAVANDQGSAVASHSGWGCQHDCRSVRAVTIEHVLQEAGWTWADILKLDCEGCEVEILAHADLSPFSLVIGEYHNASKFEEVLDGIDSAVWNIRIDPLQKKSGLFWMSNTQWNRQSQCLLGSTVDPAVEMVEGLPHA